MGRVKGNGGSPGTDGMTVDDLPGYLKQQWLEIREQLLSGTYQPQPVRRVSWSEEGIASLGMRMTATSMSAAVEQANA